MDNDQLLNKTENVMKREKNCAVDFSEVYNIFAKRLEFWKLKYPR